MSFFALILIEVVFLILNFQLQPVKRASSVNRHLVFNEILAISMI